MGYVITVVAPVFSLIVIGYLAGIRGYLSEAANKGIGEFAFKIAIPALLFRTIASAEFSGHATLQIWTTEFGAIALCWLLATAISIFILRRDLKDSPSIAMSSGFGNNVMLGLPLSVTTFGDEAAVTAAIILSIHAPLLWLAGIIHIALTRETDATEKLSIGRIFHQLFEEMRTNPIIIGILAGLLWSILGLELIEPIEKTLSLIGKAAIPAALVALGLALTNYEIKGQTLTLATILGLKLLALPLFAFLIGTYVFALPPAILGTILILTACPTGVNAFLFAQKYNRAVNSASGAIALGTALSAITFSLIILAVRPV